MGLTLDAMQVVKVHPAPSGDGAMRIAGQELTMMACERTPMALLGLAEDETLNVQHLEL